MDSLCFEQLHFGQGFSETIDIDVLHSWTADPATVPVVLEALDDPLPTK